MISDLEPSILSSMKLFLCESSVTGSFVPESLLLHAGDWDAKGLHLKYLNAVENFDINREWVEAKTGVIVSSAPGYSLADLRVITDPHNVILSSSRGVRYVEEFTGSTVKHLRPTQYDMEQSLWTQSETVENPSLARRLKALLGIQLREFDDELEGIEFKSEFTRLLRQGGKTALHIIKKIIDTESANPEALSSALEVIGEYSDPETYEERFRLMVSALKSTSRWIRDGASIGLAALGDIRALEFIEKAISAEPVSDLKEDLEGVLAYLRSIG